jgi:hypothetical protein
MRAFLASIAILTVAACQRPDAGGSAEDKAAVDAATRALITGYGAASEGPQAESALTLFSTPAFLDRLKAQAKMCRDAVAASQELPVSCAKDPIFCGEGPAPINGVSVKNVSAGVASAEVGLMHNAGVVTALVSLAKVGDAWKVDSITCPQ